MEQCTRPDISATLSELCKVQANPGQEHMRQLEHLARYVVSTKSVGLLYGGPERSTASAVLVAYADSDWAGDPETLHTRGGNLFTCWQGAVSWGSYKIKAVAASSTEAEYMNLALVVRQAKWLRYVLSDMGYTDLRCRNFGKFCAQDFARAQLSDLVDPNESPILGFGDNKGAIAVAKNPVLHKRSKHIHIAWHITRHEVNKGRVVMTYISTNENIADLMTKSLTRVPQEYLMSKFMCHRLDEALCGMDRKPMVWDVRKPVRDKLYLEQPLGLSPNFELIPVYDLSGKTEVSSKDMLQRNKPSDDVLLKTIGPSEVRQDVVAKKPRARSMFPGVLQP